MHGTRLILEFNISMYFDVQGKGSDPCSQIYEELGLHL